MPKDIVDVVTAELAAWSARTGDPVDLGEAKRLLALVRDHVGLADLTGWQPAELRQLLLDVYPRTASGGPGTEGHDEGHDAAAGVVRTLRTVLAFLDASQRLGRGALSRLQREIDAVEPRLAAAFADPCAWQAGRRLVQAMLAEGVDVMNPAAVERWMAAFGTRPYEERLVLAGGLCSPPFDDAPLLPPVRLAPVAELAAAARASRLLGRARRLAEWVGERRRLTGTGVLRRADAHAAIVELELAGDADVAAGPPRSARDVPALDRLWHLAVAAGLLTVAGTSAGPGPRLAVPASSDDQAVVELWTVALGWYLDAGVPARSRRGPHALVHEEIPGLLILLYGAEQPVRVDALADELVRHLRQRYRSVRGEVWAELTGTTVHQVLIELAELGAVTLSDGETALTPLGTWGLRHRLDAEGYDAPVVGGLAELGARELLHRIGGYPEDLAEEEYAAWPACRTPGQAADELLEAARSGTPLIRQFACAVLDRLGAAAAPRVRAALAEPELRPYAAAWLAEHGIGPRVPLTVQEAGWLLVDRGAALIDAGEPEALADHLVQEFSADELIARVSDLWRIDHPRTVDVATAIGDHHPDDAVAKAARKASFRARSRLLTGG